MVTLDERYEAAMVLGGVGDALGYKRGEFEFCHSGEKIHDEVKQLGGVDNIVVKKPTWIVSDDTVMHLATAESLTSDRGRQNDKQALYLELAKAYKECMHDMKDRAPGNGTMNACRQLKPLREGGYRTPFNPKGGGCGAAMRAMCIGLRYPDPRQLDDLIAVSVEAGRMTHNNPTGYLGSLASALFTSFAIQRKPLREWGAGLMDTLPKALSYVKSVGVDVKENVSSWNYFSDKWTNYLKLRGLTNGDSDPIFPDDFGIKARDAFYKTLSHSGWGGASGHDAPMIAYDALMSSRGDWSQLCSRGMFHSGDSDSTGTIAACCYGAMNGFQGVNERNYKNLEYKDRLVALSKKILELSKLPSE